MSGSRFGIIRAVILGGAAFLSSRASADDSPSPEVQRLTRTFFSKFFLTYSPDGSRLVYSRHHDNRRAANKILMGLRVVHADGSGDRPLMPQYDAQVQIQEHAAISPDGKSLYFTGGGNDTGNAAKDIFVCDLDAEFQATNLRKVIPGSGPQIGEQPGLSPDGKELVATDTNHNLWIVGSDGKGKRKLIQAAGNYCFQQSWSPDGEWIAFASDRDGNIELYKIRPDGTELTRLTDHSSVDCRPKWSPDARWLAFVSNRSGNEDIHVMRPDGTDVRNLTTHAAVDDHPAWSPDGKHLAFVSMRDGGFDLYRIAVPDELQVEAKPPKARGPSLTPTGDLVAHYTFDGDQDALAKDRAGNNTMQLFDAQLIQKDGRGYVRFNGKGSYASSGNGRHLHLAGPMTVSLWAKIDDANGNGYLLSKQGFNIYVGPDALPRFETRSSADDAWVTLTAADKVDVGRWTHVAVVFSPEARAMLIYVNGKPSGRLERTDGKLGAVEGHPLEFGHYVAAKSQRLTGALDEVRLFRRALADEEIARLTDEERRRVGVD
jgi:TolB protein